MQILTWSLSSNIKNPHKLQTVMDLEQILEWEPKMHLVNFS